MGWSAIASFAVAGALGGAVNAWTTDNVFVAPRRVIAGPDRRVLRVGLAISVAVGAAGGVGAALAFWPSLSVSDTSLTDSVRALMGAAIAGLLPARYVTDRADKRLLRAAVCAASAAPAAHPETVRAMENRPPAAVLSAALGLAPGDRRQPR